MTRPFSLEEVDPAILPLVIVEFEVEVLLLSPPTPPEEASRPSRSRTRPVRDKKDFARRWNAIWPGDKPAALMETLR